MCTITDFYSSCTVVLQLCLKAPKYPFILSGSISQNTNVLDQFPPRFDCVLSVSILSHVFLCTPHIICGSSYHFICGSAPSILDRQQVWARYENERSQNFWSPFFGKLFLTMSMGKNFPCASLSQKFWCRFPTWWDQRFASFISTVVGPGRFLSMRCVFCAKNDVLIWKSKLVQYCM